MAKSRFRWPTAFDLSYSVDGRLACSGRRRVVVIDVAARRRISSSYPLPYSKDVEFSPTGEALAVKSVNGRLAVIDPATGALLHAHSDQKEGEGCKVRFSQEGDALVDGSWDGLLTVRRAYSSEILFRESYPGEMIRRITHDRDRRVWLVEHSPTFRVSENIKPPGYLTVRRWPFAPRTTHRLSFGPRIHAATLSPDGSRVAFYDWGDEMRLSIASADDGKILARSAAMKGGNLRQLEWSCDGQFVGAVTLRGFNFYRASDLERLAHVPCDFPSRIVFLPGGNELLLGTSETIIPRKLGDLWEQPDSA